MVHYDCSGIQDEKGNYDWDGKNSDGSDIEIDDTDENDTLNDDFELKQVDRNADEWLMVLFDSDTENEDEFECFQEE
jgi:hypothetical protein